MGTETGRGGAYGCEPPREGVEVGTTMPRITTPQNQQLLTNVAVVRIKRGGKRFEIAAYPNMVQPWRDKVERDIGEVLQSDRVFTNVSHGKFAKKQDLIKCFSTEEEEEICKLILEKGEIQISAEERKVALERLFKEIAAIVAQKCINTETKLPLTVSYVERAMKEMNFNINATRPAKQQALVVISAMQVNLPIQRARMRVKLSAAVPDALAELVGSGALVLVEKEEAGVAVGLIDPGSFRMLDELVQSAGAQIDILDLAVVHDVSEAIEESQEQAAANRTAREAGAGAEGETCKPSQKGIQKGLTCKHCDVSFSSKEEHREHFKSEWHRYNLKLKSQERPPVSLQEFEFEQSL